MQKIFFKNKSGLKLCGIWHLPKNKTDKVIILTHGLNVDKDELGIFIYLANTLQENGFSVFRFDFRSHGESEGNSIDLRVAGEIEDLESAINYVKGEGYSEFGLLGASFGGPVAVLYALNHQEDIKCLCLWNPTLNFDHVLLNPILPKFKARKKVWDKDLKEKGWTTTGRYELKIGKGLFEEVKNLFPHDELKKIKIPTAIVHGTNDVYVPYEDSKEYVKNLKNREFISIENGEHGFQEKNPENYKTNIPIMKTVEFFIKNL